MTTEPQVTHPPVTHPETITPATATTPPEGTAKPAPRHAASRSARPGWRMPPPKVIAAVALVAVALELLLWQVAGVFWGLIAHAILAIVALVAGGFLLRRLRAQQRAVLSAVRTLRKAGGAMPQSAGRTTGGPMSRLFRRSGRTAGATGGKRGGLFGGRAGGTGRGLFGRRSGAGASSRGGLLGKLTGGRRSAGPAGRTAGGSGRSGSLLGRLGRKPVSRSAAGGGATSRRAGVGATLGRMRSSGRSLLGRSRPSGATAARTGSAGSAAKRSLGGLFSRKASKPTSKAASRNGGLAGFLRGVREGAKPKPPRPQRTPPPEPKHASGEIAESKPTAKSEKPQPPTKEQLVKEAVQRAAKAKPAAVAPQHTGGSSVSGMDRIRSAAEEFAGALKDYDEEDMHVFVKEFPHLAEAFTGISGGIKRMASRAETEWPTAAPFAEGLRSMASDVRAAAGTAEEAKGTLRRDNETDIERGEAPRGGSRHIEGRWNV